MPRAQGAQPVMGGQMHPAALEEAKRGREFTQQRYLMAFQENMATERARIAKAAQTETAGIRAGATIGAAQISAGGAKQRTAMQIEAQDRRAAQGIRADADNRQFQLERDRQMTTAQQSLTRLQSELSGARKKEDWTRADELTEKVLDAAWNERMLYNMHDSANLGASIDMIDRLAEGDADREKARVEIEELNRKHDDQQGLNAACREDIGRSIGGNTRFSFEGTKYEYVPYMKLTTAQQRDEFGGYAADDALGEELKKLNMPDMTMQMLTDRGYSKLEESVGVEKNLGFGELVELYILLDESADFAEDQIAGSTGDEETFYKHFLGRVSDAHSVLDRLRTSEKEEVKDIATSAWQSYRGEGPKARLKSTTGKVGLDLTAIIEDNIRHYQSFDAGLFRGEYAEDFAEELERKIASRKAILKRRRERRAARQKNK